MTGRSYLAVGHRFQVELPDHDARTFVESGLIDLACPADPDPAAAAPVRYWIRPNDNGWYAIGRDDVTLRPHTSVEAAFATLLWDVNQRAAASAGDLLVVHAAAVATGDVGVLLPGSSGAGKSTLAAALVRGGMDYLSDELAVINPGSGRVTAYPKPITLEAGAAQHFPNLLAAEPGRIEDHLPASRLRAGSVASSATARHLIFPRFDVKGQTKLCAIGPADALSRLAANMMHPRGSAALPALAQIVERCACSTLDYHDLDAARELIPPTLEGDR